MPTQMPTQMPMLMPMPMLMTQGLGFRPQKSL
jgi:hypothetical protein